MESRIVTVYEYKDIDISSFQKKFQPDEEAIQYEMNRLVQKYIKWEPGEEVHVADMVVCSLKSKIAKFNKENIKLIVESGMFHKELEKELIGLKKGEKKIVILDEEQVEIEVKEVTNKIVPPVTDEIVKSLGLASVSNAKEYKEYLLKSQRQEAAIEEAYPAIQYVVNSVDTKSDLILKQADWARMAELEMERYRVLSRQEGLELEKMTQKDFDGKIPVSSYHELAVIVQKNAWSTLIHYLLGLHYAKQDKYKVSKESYEDFIKEYVKTWNVTIEQAKESNQYEYYEVTSYTSYYYTKIKQYVEENIYLEV